MATENNTSINNICEKTNFEKVQEFNRAFDMAPKDPINYKAETPYQYTRSHLLTDDIKLIQLRLDLIKEELGELQTAIKENNFIETRDALSDILYVL